MPFVWGGWGGGCIFYVLCGEAETECSGALLLAGLKPEIPGTTLLPPSAAPTDGAVCVFLSAFSCFITTAVIAQGPSAATVVASSRIQHLHAWTAVTALGILI